MSDPHPPPKIILITGEENIDRGILPAAIGALLKANGYKVTIIKIDQCFNNTSLGLDPSKYGERYCLQDGAIVPINFGYYERFLDQFFTGDHYVTYGKVKEILDKKRDYNSHYSNTNDKAQFPTFVNEIDQWFQKVFHTPIDDSGIANPEICIIDFEKSYEETFHDCHGTCNFFDGMPFSKAISALKNDNGQRKFMHIHIPKVIGDSVGESIKFLIDHHFDIDMIICRNNQNVFEKYQEEIAKMSNLPSKMILNVIPKISDDFVIPLFLQNNRHQNAYQLIAEKLDLRKAEEFFASNLKNMKIKVEKAASFENVIKIAFVGRFFKSGLYPGEIFEASDATAIQSLKTAAAAAECGLQLDFVYGPDLENDVSDEVRNAAFAKLEEADGIHFPSGNNWGIFYGFMKACKLARERKKPFLALSYGFQIAAFEFVQNVCGVRGPLQPISEEENAENESCNYDEAREGFKFKDVIVIMREKGGPVKSGNKQVHFLTKDSKIFQLYGSQNPIFERHSNTCEIDPAIAPRLISAGLRLVGVSFDESERERNPKDFQQLLSVAQSSMTAPKKDRLPCFSFRLVDDDNEKIYIQSVKALSKKFVEDKKEFKTAVRFSMFELKDHPFYVGTNFYGKYGGIPPSDPSPLYLGFIEAAKQYKADRI